MNTTSDIGHQTSSFGHPTLDKKHRTSHRAIALFFVATFLNTLIPYNQLWANNNGPNAPEAAAFEPVDATDMVNLATGDLSYVLPLLNIPSPEGGYPLALSYHAGIAMDQEASWVGLGWSLNPGAINRSVNGYPDDWGKTRVTEFYYDEGWEEDAYDFSIGGTFPNGLTLGVGASWGSNRSFGGSVTFGGAGFNMTVGSDKFAIGVGSGGASIGISSNGGITVGLGANNGNYSANINYNSNNGLAGGVGFQSTAINDQGNTKTTSIGISMSSQGASPSFNGYGGSTINSSSSINNGDYDVDISTSGINLDVGIFWFGYNHTNIKYSLHQRNYTHVSGILYPFHAKKMDEDSPNYLEKHHYMDILKLDSKHVETNISRLDIGNQLKFNFSKITLPNYDNYSVNAQGLSGVIKPYILDEIDLYGVSNSNFANGSVEQSDDNDIDNDIDDPNINYSNDLNNKTFFYFKNQRNSFLRINKGAFPTKHYNTIDENYLLNLRPNVENTFSTTTTTQGDLIKSGNRKRGGEFIEVFKNEDIILGNVTGFIEAKGIDRLQDPQFFNESVSIGAYKITALDGKTYHYSLPVYQFESFYKNYEEKDKENKKFLEVKKDTPYATHWLLTAITGPDYFDKNNNNTLDKDDYGYWVEFDYGKWSDGYAWRSPKEGAKELGGRYSYFWGRKQIFYLDAIRTRTHTALFSKKIRLDAMSNEFNQFKTQITSAENFDRNLNCELFGAEPSSTLIGNAGDKFFLSDDSIFTPIFSIKGRETNFRYVDIPKNFSLKLDKIILLKNDDAVYSKSRGNLISTLKGYSHFGLGYTDIKYSPFGGRIPNLFDEKNELSKFDIHQHQNVLDDSDIIGLGLEEKAIKIIDFTHNYELAKDTPNSNSSEKGKLTLKSLSILGKRGTSVVPPYTFKYYNVDNNYNKELSDEWGYYKDAPASWSLNQIKSPVGSTIAIEYEPDSYNYEAFSYNYVAFGTGRTEEWIAGGLGSVHIESIKKGINTLTLNFKESYNEEKFDLLFKGLAVEVEYGTMRPYEIFDYRLSRAITPTDRYVVSDFSKTEKWVKIKTTDVTKYHSRFPANPNGDEKITFRVGQSGFANSENPNGRSGGGIRTKEVKTIQNELVENSLIYDYINPITNVISGITSYTPTDNPNPDHVYAPLAPSPGVMYEYVNVQSKDGNNKNINKATYQFEVLEPFHHEFDHIYSLGESFKVEQRNYQDGDEDKIVIYNNIIHDKLSNLGRLKSISEYNNENQIVRQLKHNYKKDLSKDSELGVIQESFRSMRRGKTSVFRTGLFLELAGIVEYPSVLESTSISQAGFTNTEFYNKHDFLTGQVTETTANNGKGVVIKNKIIPAYHIANYSGSNNGYGMGAKVDNPTNKNMLTQTAATLTQIKEDDNWKTINASINTWNNDWTYRNYDGETSRPSNDAEKTWRTHQSFAWKGDLDKDGAYSEYTGDDDNFNWSDPDNQSNANWINTSTTSLYDHYSMPLEITDINNNSASTKMTIDDCKIESVANAAYIHQYYAGAEYLLEEDTDYIAYGIQGGNYQNATKAHTGIKSLKLNAGNQGFKVDMPADSKRPEDYKVSVWVDKANASKARININGATKAFNGEQINAGDWTLLNHYENLSSGAETIYITATSGTIYADDFRMLPAASSMTSYVYNEWDELSYIIGANNLATQYIYDDAGRLKQTKIEVINTSEITGGFKLSEEINYNYNQPLNIGGDLDLLSLNIGISNQNGSNITLIAHANGGTREYEYRWAISSNSNGNFSYGSWNASNTTSLSTQCGTGGRRYYRCQVRDKSTLSVKQASGNHQRQDCGGGGGGGGGDPINHQ